MNACKELETSHLQSLGKFSNLNKGSLANPRSESNDCILNGALLQIRAVADDHIIDLAAHNLGRRKEAGGCVDRGLGVVEFELRWLQ